MQPMKDKGCPAGCFLMPVRHNTPPHRIAERRDTALSLCKYWQWDVIQQREV